MLSFARQRRSASLWRIILHLLLLVWANSASAANWDYAIELQEVKGYVLPDLMELDGAVVDLSQAPFVRRNPALIQDGQSSGLCVEYLMRTGDSRNATYDGMVLSHPELPVSIQAGTSWGKLRLGAGWEQRYNSHREVQDTWFRQQDSLWFDYDSRLERWNFQAAWELFPTTEERFGLTVGGGFGQSSLRIDQAELKSYTGVMNWQFGLRADLRGAHVAFALEDKSLFSHQKYFYMDIPSGGQLAVDSLLVWGVSPKVLHTQVGYVPAPGWELNVNLRYHMYSGQLLAFDDRMETGVVLHHRLNSGVRVQAGFVTSGTTALYGNADPVAFSEEMDTVYLLAGVQVPFHHALFSLKVADSHVGGGDYRKQTQVQAALQLKLPRLPLPVPALLR